MAMIYKLRMLSDENDNFLREYEVDGSSTLFDLHNLISDDLGFERDGVVSFFASDAKWNKLVEFTLVDMGEEGPIPMQNVTVADVLNLPQARLIYLFDMFNDRSLYIESGGSAKPATNTVYPRVATSVAPAPNQYEPSGTESNNSIFDEAMSEFEDFEGDDYYDDEF